MVLRPPVILALLVALLAILAGVATLIPHGGERLVARATSKVAAQTLRDCLGSRLGLTWAGDSHAMHANVFGMRVVVSDSGKARQIGMFTAGGRQLSNSETEALKACLQGQ